ncbi:MAG: hypothetical protein ACK5Q5_16505, partial [Planctomycetaceae bacterium]
MRIGLLPPAGEPNVQLGLGSGNGTGRLQLNCGGAPAHIEIINSGSGQGTMPPILLQGTHSELTIESVGGEAGFGLRPNEPCRFKSI